MRKRMLVAAAAASVAVLGAAPFVSSTDGARATTYASLRPIQKRLLSGAATAELAPSSASARARAPIAPVAPRAATAAELANYVPGADGACRIVRGDNVKVNQNCVNLVDDPSLFGRGQAQNEPFIAADPNSPSRVVASSNDYRRGDGNCWTERSGDGGATWRDAEAPMSFTPGGETFGTAREYWQSGGDTSLAWDTRGNVYLSCQVFNRGAGVSPNRDESSALLVFRSTANRGASWTFPAGIATQIPSVGGPGALLDKQLIAVDGYAASPFRDRVYVTFTGFAEDGTGYIYEVHSADYGATWSTPVVVSRDSSICQQTYGLPTPSGRCNENQDSQPFVGPDGTLYVAYNNFNNAVSGNENFNVVFLARSTDGGQTFSSPSLVSRFYDLPDCAAYQEGQDEGRACVPEKGSATNSIFRASNYPVGVVNPARPNQVAVTFGSYINRNSNERNGCVPQGLSEATFLNLYAGVKRAGACNNDIVVSVSNDGGRTFTGDRTDVRNLPTATNDPGQRTTDQWFQWADFAPNGTLAVSYYDRQYGADEMNGMSDFSLSSSASLSAFAVQRLTSSSMPLPTQFDGSFWGDYTGLTAAGGVARAIWSDTRDLAPVTCPGTPPRVCTGDVGGTRLNDENSYTASRPLP